MASEAPQDLPREATQRAAKWLVTYFDRVNNAFPEETWCLGFDTAKEWLRLTEAVSVSPEEVSSLIAIVQINQRRSTAWDLMALWVYSWATENGFGVPKPSLGPTVPE